MVQLAPSDAPLVVELDHYGPIHLAGPAPVTILRRPSGITREQLSDDQDALESFYRLEGFSQATVGEPAVTTTAEGTLLVDFPITEGPQTLIADVRIAAPTRGNEDGH